MKSRNQRPTQNKSAQRSVMNKSLNRYKQGCQFTTNLDSSEGSSVVEEEKSVKYNKDLLSELKQPNKSKSISQNENSLQF